MSQEKAQAKKESERLEAFVEEKFRELVQLVEQNHHRPCTPEELKKLKVLATQDAQFRMLLSGHSSEKVTHSSDTPSTHMSGMGNNNLPKYLEK